MQVSVRGEERNLSYLEPFFEDHSWDSLQIARAAMSTSKRKAEQLELPEEQMAFDDYDALLQSGANVGTAQTAVSTFQGRKEEALLTYWEQENGRYSAYYVFRPPSSSSLGRTTR